MTGQRLDASAIGDNDGDRRERIEHFKREVEEERRNPQVTAAYRKRGRDESSGDAPAVTS